MYIALISFVILVSAVVVQGFISPETVTSITGLLPPGVRQWVDLRPTAVNAIGNKASSAASSVASNVQSAIPSVHIPTRLTDILHLHKSKGGGPDTKAIVLRTQPSESNELSIDVVPDREEYLKQDTKARHWHELEEHEQRSLKEALIKAGHWAVDEGETVLKGILFSSYAGLVGQAAAQALR